MKTRDDLIREKILQRLLPIVEIEVDENDNSFFFPKLSSLEVAKLKEHIKQYPNKEIEVMAGEKTGKLRISADDSLELIFL